MFLSQTELINWLWYNQSSEHAIEGYTMISFKGRHTPKEVILQCVRSYCAYPLSYRNIEEIMPERSVIVDHSGVKRRSPPNVTKLPTAGI